MGNTKVEDSILQSIGIVVKQALDTAQYDKTIQAVVRECVDATIGKYRVEYQDSNFYAYSENTNTKYAKGTLVYIHIPKNDFDQIKTIIGSVKKQGVNYISVPQGDEGYIYTGENRISNPDKSTTANSLSVSSFYGSTRKQYNIYKYKSNNNIIDIDQEKLLQDIKVSNCILLGAKIRTAIPPGKQLNGNYGIVADLVFRTRNKKQPTVIHSCYLDINKMTGDPYNYKIPTRQYGIFEGIDSQNFVRVNRIYLFTEGFSETASKKTKDIFFSDVEIYGLNRLTDQQLASYLLSIEPGFARFDSDSKDTDSITLKAIVRIKGKPVTSDQKIKYYWFKQNTSVSSGSDLYCDYGGNGWQCLNKYTKTADGKIEWIPASNTYEVFHGKIYSQQNIFLCVAVCQDDVILQQKKLVLKPAGPSVSIVSDSGTVFYYDIGQPTITCLINKQDIPSKDSKYYYFYHWTVETKDGNFINLDLLKDNVKEQDFKAAQDSYLNKLTEIAKLTTDLKNNKVLKTSGEENLEKLQKELQAIRIDIASKIRNEETPFAVVKNKIIKIPTSCIQGSLTFKCAVYKNTKDDENTANFIGVASIEIMNNLQEKKGFNLIINNGTQNFKYNEFGISPASQTLNNPIKLLPLSFTLFDPDNRQIINSKQINTQDNIDFSWQIPAENTLLTSSDNNIIDTTKVFESQDGSIYKSTVGVLPYKIKDNYDINCKRNNIKLKLAYEGMAFVAETNFSFIKQGQMGTNGTEYVSKIQPIRDNKHTENPYYPTIYLKSSNETVWSFDKTNWTDGKTLRFKVLLFHNNQQVFDSTSTSNAVNATIKWSIVKNNYKNNKGQDNSFIQSIDSKGTITLLDQINNSNNTSGVTSLSQAVKSSHSPACVIKAQIYYRDKDRDDIGLYQYAYLPIVFSLNTKVTNTNKYYQINLEPYTGFNYAVYTPDGTRPVYDNAVPHTLKVTQNIKNKWQDITNNAEKDYKLTYKWSLLGTVYKYNDNNNNNESNYINNELLLLWDNKKNTNLLSNQRFVKPIDNYSSRCLTNNVKCEIYQGNTYVGEIIMPIHLMLNQYGNAKLNGWDGNSIDIDNKGGVILAPQVGAGKKNNDNTFTGILMGEVKMVQDEKKEDTKTGLFGFSHGNRSIFLDADTGNATFGVTGQGQIQLIPNGTSTIAGWAIGKDFLSTISQDGTVKGMKDKLTGAYLGADGTFQFASGAANEQDLSSATEYNYIRYSPNGKGGRDLQIVGGNIRGGSIEISEPIQKGDKGKTPMIFKANTKEIQFGNWSMNRRDSNGRANRDVFYYGDWDDSSVGFSGNPNDRAYLWAGYDKEHHYSIHVDEGGCSFDKAVYIAPTGGLAVNGPSRFNEWVQFGGPEKIWVDSNRTLEAYIQSLMPEEDDEEGGEGEDEG